LGITTPGSSSIQASGVEFLLRHRKVSYQFKIDRLFDILRETKYLTLKLEGPSAVCL